MAKITVGLVEDHHGYANGYRFSLLNSKYDIEIVWEASTFEQAQAYLAEQVPGVLILDAGVPISDEDSNRYPIFASIRSWLDKYDDMEIMVVSNMERGVFIRNVKNAGASGYITKGEYDESKKIDEIIHLIYNGGVYYSARAKELLAQVEAEEDLNNTQQTLIEHVSSYPNKTLREVGDDIGLAYATVRNNMNTIYITLDVNTKAAAIEEARRRGWTTEPDSKI